MTKFTKEKVLLLHQYIAAETGGGVGVRDEGLLEWVHLREQTSEGQA